MQFEKLNTKEQKRWQRKIQKYYRNNRKIDWLAVSLWVLVIINAVWILLFIRGI